MYISNYTTMKNSSILFGLLAFSIVACTSLDEEPKSFLSTDQFYKTQADAVAAVNAIYYQLSGDFNGQQPLYNALLNTGMDFMTDDVSAGPGSPNPDVRSLSVLAHSATVIRGKEIWEQDYEGINRANVALENIPNIQFDEAVKNRLLGEALFLRALFYFNLVRLYGDVPLTLKDQTKVPIAELTIPRTDKEIIYQQIITDLTDAITRFQAGKAGEAGRATEGAAKSLLSKVHLTRREWDKAVAYSDEVINGSYGYDLMPEYSQVFLPAYKNNKEHIFSVQFKANANSQGNNVTSREIMNGIPGLAGSYGDQVTFYKQGNDKFFSIYKMYSSNDKRRKVTFTTKYLSPTTNKWYGRLNDPTVPGDSVPFFNKYWDPAAVLQTSQSSTNANILRFAEVLLINSEAENELNGPTVKAYASLNRVRHRAGLNDLAPGLSKDQFRDSVYLDRRLELVYEYQRWFDLIRQIGPEQTGVGPEGRGTLLINLHKVGKTNASEKHYLFPIPQLEIDRNPKLKQNPGWE
jgi:hypothetical protein